MRRNRCFGGSVTCGAKFLMYPLYLISGYL
jgi:hypothetical protein